MAQTHIKQVMEEMGWTDGNMIPVANEENRNLLNMITELLKKKAEQKAAFETAEARVTSLTTYLKNAESTIEHNIKLINANRSQLTTETHLQKLAEFNCNRYSTLLKDLEKEHDEIKQFEESTEQNINRLQKNIEKHCSKIDWAKQALDEWREAMSKGDEANKLIERFCKDDQSHANKLENKRRMLQDSINKEKKTLIDLTEDQKSKEQVLQRTAQLYRQAHVERQNLIKTWRDAVNQMTQRENDIVRIEEEIAEAETIAKDKKAKLKEQEDFLNQQIANNKEVEATIDELNTEVSETKKKLSDIEDESALRANEVKILQKDLDALIQNLQHRRQRNKKIVEDKMRIEQAAKDTEQQIQGLEERYKKFKNESMSAADRLERLDELLETEEKIKIQLNQETIRLNNILYKTQQQVSDLKNEEKIINNESRGTEAAIANLRKATKDDELELAREIELLYDLGHQVEQLEQKLSRLMGVEKDAEKQARITELEEHDRRATEQLNLIQSQVKQVDDEMRQLTNIYNKDNMEMEKLSSTIKEKEAFYEGSTRKLKEQTSENQEKLVELSVLKMRMNQMENQISKQDDKLFNIEKHRLEMEKTMNERMIHVKSQLDLLNLKKKHLMDELSTLKADVAERKTRIGALKARYEVSVDLLGKNEDGSVVTVTQLRIEAAQEKQLLLQQGNELNEKVINAEKDIKAMENTLCLINYSNDAYRKSFGQKDEENPQLAELKDFKKTYCELLTKLRSVQGNVALRQAELEEASRKHEELERELEELNRNRMDNNDILIKIHKELTDQKQKLQRAERELKAARKVALQRCNGPNFELFECELDLRELEGKNTTALQLLADLVDASPEMAPVVSTLLYEKDLKIPQAKHGKTLPTCHSEFSERSIRSVSQTSLQMFSATSGTSKSSGTSCSSSTTRHNMKTRAGGSSAHPSIVSLEFPDMKSRKSGSGASGSSKKN